MNILVTGGSGFIGTNLVSYLLKDGHKVSIYDKRISESYPELCILGDVRDREKLAISMHGIDAVYHLAAEHRDDVRPTSLYYEVNVGGAENLIYAMEKDGIKTLIFTSSVSIYGLNSGSPTEESPVKPFNDYGWSKFKSELVFNEWAKGDDTRSLVIVRPSVIFGEKNRGNVYNLLSQIASGKFIMVGNGQNRKSMGYVLNLTHFLTMLLVGTSGGNIYNYADKPDLNMDELVETALKAFGKGGKVKCKIPYIIGLFGGYVFDLLAGITGKTYPISSIRIKKFCADTRISAGRLREIGFKAPYSLAEGLERMISSDFLEAQKNRV